MSEILLQPLEQLAVMVLPDALNGALGSNRKVGKALIKAKTDLEAIHCWLAEYANKPTTTYHHYRKDAERLLLWALTERNKPLASLNADDLLAYSHFLDNPSPFEKWCVVIKHVVNVGKKVGNLL